VSACLGRRTGGIEIHGHSFFAYGLCVRGGELGMRSVGRVVEG